MSRLSDAFSKIQAFKKESVNRLSGDDITWEELLTYASEWQELVHEMQEAIGLTMPPPPKVVWDYKTEWLPIYQRYGIIYEPYKSSTTNGTTTPYSITIA